MLRVPAIALSLCISALCFADDGGSSDLEKEILVVAKRWKDVVGNETASVAVIGASDIAREQSSRVDSLLREVPGVYVVRDGPAGQFSRLFIRGAASNQTLVVVDGIPQNDATTGGGFDFNDLTTTGIERIEVLRGSYGVLYGSEAIGGVVHVTTRRGSGPGRGFVRFEGGSFGTHRESVGYSFGDDVWDAALTLGNFRTDGERDDEEHTTRDLSARLGYQAHERLRFDATVRVADSETESPFDFPFGTILPPDGNITRTRDTVSVGGIVTWDALDWLTVRAAVSRLDVESEFENGPDGPTLIDPDFTPGSGDEFTVTRDEFTSRSDETDDRWRLEATAFLGDALGWTAPEEGGIDVEITAGHEWIEEESATSNTSPEFNAATTTTTERRDVVDTRAGFAQASVYLPDLLGLTDGVVTAGVRRDRHEAFGSESSPYLGARARVLSTDTTLRAAYGEGIRAPKPSELFDAFVGNATLGAETSESVDIGVEQPLLDGDVTIGVTWFRLRVEDLIAFDSTFTSGTRPFGALVNFTRTETEGTEWSAVWDLGDGFRARGTYTRQNPRDRTTGDPLPNRAQQFGSVGVTWERGAVAVSLTGTFSGRHHGQGGEIVYPEGREREEPGRRRVVDLAARYGVSPSVTVFGRIENLFDDDWVATPTSPAGPPLGVYAGLQIDF